jgi:hypothetical protein
MGEWMSEWVGEWTDEWMSGWCWVMGLYYSMGSISIDTRLLHESVGRCKKFKILKDKYNSQNVKIEMLILCLRVCVTVPVGEGTGVGGCMADLGYRH